MQVCLQVETRDSLRVVGGRSLLGRLVAQLRSLAVGEIAIAAPPALHREIEAELDAIDPPAVELREAAPRPATGEAALRIEADRVLDPRILLHALGRSRPGPVVDDLTGEAAPVGVEVLSDSGERTAHPLSRIPRYSPALRRELDPYWQPVGSEPDERAARDLLARAAGKGHQEWLVLVLNRPVETWISRWLCETAISPNQITLFGVAVALWAAWLYASGAIGAGVLVALAAQIIDGLDGRQARIQLRFSRFGRFEHTLDKITEAAWIFALGWHFSGQGQESGPLLAAALWFAAATACNAAGSLFRARRGGLPEESSRFDAFVRLVSARRNTSTAYLGLGWLAGYPAITFRLLVGLTVATALISWSRVAWRLAREGSDQPPETVCGPGSRPVP